MKVTIEGTPKEIQVLMKKEPHGSEVLSKSEKQLRRINHRLQDMHEILLAYCAKDFCGPWSPECQFSKDAIRAGVREWCRVLRQRPE